MQYAAYLDSIVSIASIAPIAPINHAAVWKTKIL